MIRKKKMKMNEDKFTVPSLTVSCVVALAATNGNFYMLKWLRKKGCTWNPWTFENAANNGCLVIWNQSAFECAAYHESLDIMIWLLKNECPWDVETFQYAATHGSLQNMMWLLKNRCSWDESTFSAAARHGHLGTLNWLIENEYSVPRGISAAKNLGDDLIIQCMRNNGYRVAFIKE